MPPQQTNPASESDAAVLGLDLTIALVKATYDALPEKNAAGPTAVPTRNVFGLLERYWRAFWQWRQRQRSPASVHELSDKELMDIGLTRDDIDHIAPHRAIDALRNSIHSRGVI